MMELLEKTFDLLRGWKAGDTPPEQSFDENEILKLGQILKRLLFAPASLRKRLQELGVTITPANFYSEIPTISDIENSFAGGAPSTFDTIFDPARMREMLSRLHAYSEEFDPPVSGPSTAFSWRGGQYSFSDAMSYYCMVRHVKPRTIVEVGSGWSTLVADAAIRRNGHGKLICIEPFPPEFLAAIRSVSELIRQPVQSLTADFFNQHLQDGDVLFIDSTHTVKHGSDCLHLYLDIIPKLRADLSIHAHDIYLPEPLPLALMRDRQIYWTEQYLLYAYLLNNPRVETLYGSLWHMRHHRKALEDFMHGRFGAGGAAFWFHQKG